MIKIRAEHPDDNWQVEQLFDLSFGPGREALSSYRLRDGVAPVHFLCFVAHDDADIIMGAIRFWPIKIGTDRVDTLLLGPIAIHPTLQGEGLGSQLIHHGLQSAKNAGWTRVVLIGDLDYYARFGFERNAALRFPAPTNPQRVLSKALQRGAFDHVAGDVRK